MAENVQDIPGAVRTATPPEVFATPENAPPSWRHSYKRCISNYKLTAQALMALTKRA